MARYRTREEMMRHRLSVRIKGTPEMVDRAASMINDVLPALGQVVEWSDRIQDRDDPNKVHVFLNVDTNAEVKHAQ